MIQVGETYEQTEFWGKRIFHIQTIVEIHDPVCCDLVVCRYWSDLTNRWEFSLRTMDELLKYLNKGLLVKK